MNRADLQSWSARRWSTTLAVVLLLHVALVWFFGRGLDPAQGPTPVSTRMHFVVDPDLTVQLDGIPDVRDAALLPMPGPAGFSSGGWLAFQPMRHALLDWTNTSSWLALDESALGVEFNRLVEASVPPPRRVADVPAPPLAGHRVQVPNIAVRKQSSLRVEGPLALAGRAPRQPPPLPSWPHGDLLTNTVVQLLVDSQGWVFSATLLASSGLPDADRWAMQQVQGMPWTPVPTRPNGAALGDELAHGRLVFEWHTLPASADLSTAKVAPGGP